MTPQESVERALQAAAHLHGCVVLVRESSEAVLRWANSTMTTNGHSTATRVTVIAFVAVEGGVAAGVVGSAEPTDPVGCTQRRRMPVEVPSQVVVISWLAKP